MNRHNTISKIVVYAKHEMVMSDMRQKCLLQPEMRRQGNNVVLCGVRGAGCEMGSGGWGLGGWGVGSGALVRQPETPSTRLVCSEESGS